MPVENMEEDNNNTDIIGIDECGIPEYREISVADLEAPNSDVTGPRLVISQIVIENFKSYAGVKVLGPFHKNFTAIIGPNGSGKSNVIDSILFVFGFRATKIRSKKLAVLIHDSDEHKEVNHCSVVVHFQQIIDEGSREDDKFQVVEGSHFEVSRTAFKDGSSYYKFNDRKVHYKEIEKALMTAGVDLVHNRFLILQGEVEQIALMKPKSVNKNEDGMLEFLEDIIGSNRFKEPIQVLSSRLTDLSELTSEKYQRVQMIEGEKNELAEEREEALSYLTIENDIAKTKNKILHKDLFKVRRSEEEAKGSREKVEEESNALKEKYQQVDTMIKEKTKQYKEFFKQCNKVLEEKAKNKEKFQWFEERDAKLQVEMKHGLSSVKKLEGNIQQEELRLKEYKMIPGRQEKEIEVLNKKMEKTEGEKKEQEEKFDEVMATFQNETKDLQAEKFNKESDLLELQKSVSENKQKYQLAQGELDVLKSSQNKEANKMADISRNINRLQSSIEEKKGLLGESKEKFPGIKESLEKAKGDLESLNSVEKGNRDVVNELSKRVEIARSSLHTAQNQNKVLDFLMDLKRSGKVPAILGRLGDLGAIDKRYDVAISTACGLLDYIVVEDMNTAQHCIEELQRAEVGRSSFIGLDKMAVWKAHCQSKNRTFPEDVPRLFDLVKVNNADLVPAFYFALRDTLVAKDIHQATRIAYGTTRYRVVTLGGQLIDLSGAMSGGGKRVSSGKMGSQIKADVNPRELEKMERELDKAQRELQSGHENRFRLQQGIESLQKGHREVSTSIQKLSNEIKSMSDQLDSFHGQLQELEGRMKNVKHDDKKVKAQEERVQRLKLEYDKVQKVATDMEDQIEKIYKEIMDIGGSQFKSIETKKILLESQLEQLRSTVNKLTVAIKTAQRKATKSGASIESLKAELKEMKEKLIGLREEKGKIEKEAHQLLTCLNKVDAEVKENQTELSRISGVLSQYNEEEKESKRLLMEVGHKLKKAEEDEKQASEKCAVNRQKLSALALHEIDGRPKEELEKFISEDEVKNINTPELVKMISIAGEKIKSMRPNMASIEEYKKKEEIFLKRVDELTKVSNLKQSQKKQHDQLKKRRLEEFITGFSTIKNKLKEMYQTITEGGNAELELVDTLDAFAEGILFSVRPAKKSWKNISNLSGGEKTLSSLALIFALHQYKATPFYVMDEIDAALDFKNASIVANYIKRRTENAQFIVISLRSNTFEMSDRLIGIYKTFNCTKSITLNLSKNKISNRHNNTNPCVGSSGSARSSSSSATADGRHNGEDRNNEKEKEEEEEEDNSNTDNNINNINNYNNIINSIVNNIDEI